MKVIKLVIIVLFGLMFLNAGLNKFFNYMPVPELTPEQLEAFGAFMKLSWLMPLVGAAEVVGGILVIPPKTRALGAIILLPVMVGVLAHHATMDPSGIYIPLAMFIILLWVILDNWKKYQPMISEK